jgi:hypothetical protein
MQHFVTLNIAFRLQHGPFSPARPGLSSSKNTWRKISEKAFVPCLPDEVLENVFREDILRPTHLRVLALVCCRFSRLIRESLYNEVQICLLREKHMALIRTLPKYSEPENYPDIRTLEGGKRIG